MRAEQSEMPVKYAGHEGYGTHNEADDPRAGRHRAVSSMLPTVEPVGSSAVAAVRACRRCTIDVQLLRVLRE